MVLISFCPNFKYVQFFTKMNALSYVTYVLIDTPSFISEPNINDILFISAKSSIKIKNKNPKQNKRPISINKNNILHHPNLLDL